MIKFKIALSAISLLFLFVACQEGDFQNDEVSTTRPLTSGTSAFSGLDMEGNERTCNDHSDLICSQVFTESDQYALDCQREGNLAVACGCHDWICVDMEEISDRPVQFEIGYNIEGEVESCQPFENKVQGDEVFCSSVFTEEDQFAIDCQEAGHKAVMCGCHKYICVE